MDERSHQPASEVERAARDEEEAWDYVRAQGLDDMGSYTREVMDAYVAGKRVARVEVAKELFVQACAESAAK